MLALPDILPRNLTVMVVDPDPHARHVMRRFQAEIGLQDADYAASVREALALQSDKSPPVDLVISELHLPDGDGLSLSSLMRARQPELAVIIASWDSSEVSVNRARSSEVTSYLSKPISPKQLREKAATEFLRNQALRAKLWLRSIEGLAFIDDATPEMRMLFDMWNELRGDEALPSPSLLSKGIWKGEGNLERHLFLVEVEQPKPRLRYAYVGEALASRLTWRVQGKYLDEQNFIYRRYAQPAYDRALKHRLPHYRHIGAVERMILFRYRRLLLPFGDQNGVQSVLGYVKPR